MKFIHAGLQVNKQDLKPFYVEILGFSENFSFNLQSELAEQIFEAHSTIEVFNLIKSDIQLELFVTDKKHKPGFNHLCLLESDLSSVKEKAQQLGYKFIVRQKPDKETVFLYDSMENMFELKNRL